jgi:hypothetical protein
MSRQIASRCRGSCVTEVGNSWSRYASFTVRSAIPLIVQRVPQTLPLSPGKWGTKDQHHKLPYSAPIPFDIARVPTYD